MKNAIRCCISCILPCGALDVIRIVHANGRVEEISGSVKAEEIMKAHPKHVLKKPSSSSSSSSGDQDHDHKGMCPKIVIVPPDAELQRGKIYFLMPLPSNSSEKTSRHNPMKKKSKPPESTTTNTATITKPRSSSTPSSINNNSSSTRRKKRELAGADHHHHHRPSSIGRNNISSDGNGNGNSIPVDNFLMSDRYLSEILSEKVSTQRDRRRGRAGVWRPHLESISESITSTPGDQAC